MVAGTEKYRGPSTTQRTIKLSAAPVGMTTSYSL
jgi:hypothetical protein